jgi:phosphoesterase RecJ-like protein
VQAGANPAAIARMVYGSATERELRVMGSFLQRMETASEGRFALSWITPEETGLDTESFVETLTTLGGLEIGAFLRPADEGGWKLSLRSRGEADVAAIASKWGGGGHAKAAGANLEGSLDEVKKEVRQTCLEAIERLGREEP